MKYLGTAAVALTIIVLLLIAILLMLSPISDASKADVVVFVGICIGILVALFVASHVGAGVGRFLVWLFLENAESRTPEHKRPKTASAQTRPTTEFAERVAAEQIALNGDDLIEEPKIGEGQKMTGVDARARGEHVEFSLILIIGILLAICAGIGCSNMKP